MQRGGWLIAGCVGAGLLLSAPADARVFFANKLGDPAEGACTRQDCTLREAVIAANNRSGPDVVELRAGRTYTITQAGFETQAASGDFDVSGTTTIRSTSRRKRATVDANRVDRAFRNFAPLTLNGINVRGTPAGAILGQEAPLIIRKARIGSPGDLNASVAQVLTGGLVLDRTVVVNAASTAIIETDDGDLRASRTVVKGAGNNAYDESGSGSLRLTRSRASDAANIGAIEADGGNLVSDRFQTKGSGNSGIVESGTGSLIARRSLSADSGNLSVAESDSGNLVASRLISRGGVGLIETDDGDFISKRVRVTGADGYAVSSVGAGRTTVTRARLTNSDGGVFAGADGGTTIRKTMISGNQQLGPATDGIGIHGSQSDGATLRVLNSTIAGNTGSGDGAGIYLQPDSGTLLLRSSTVSNNTTTDDSGGGVSIAFGSQLIAVNSTIAGNRADLSGGGLRVEGEARLNAVTVVRNVANFQGASVNNAGGGINASGGGSFASIRNSLIALNRADFGAQFPDCNGPITTSGRNLIGNFDGCTWSGSDIERAKPRIGRLKRNGGPTKTVALKRNSPAINKAGNDAPNRDQRGRKRRNPDIGAFER